jgi:hypothetical protein
MFIYCYAI